MVRDGLLLFVGSVCLLMVGATCTRSQESETPSRIERLLAVNRALRQGRDYIQRGEFEAAVRVLESQLEWIDANRDYLSTLREAYFNHIRQLQKQGEEAEVARYLRRLRAIDPGATLELKRGAPTAPVASAPPAPTNPPSGALPPTKPEAKPLPKPEVPNLRVRAEVEDPFSEQNSREYQDALALIVRADREFEDKDYAEAAQYYELAGRASPKAVEKSKQRWGYCKMHAVVERLNSNRAIDGPRLEREVRSAMTMAPNKLEQLGRSLLDKIRSRTSGSAAPEEGSTRPAREAVAVTHGAKQSGWQVAESEHFRIFHNQSRETAEQAARIAERTRVTMAQHWFGDNGRRWGQKCDVYLHADEDAYAKATGQSPSCPGHSTIHSEGERVLSRRIDLHCDNVNMMRGVLPHETTHVVLAGRFGNKDLPRWADEGMAVLTEPRDRIELHLQNLARYRKEGKLFKMESLLPMTDYPEAKYVSSFYAQSVSVVEFLSERKGPRVFAHFVKDGMHRGFEAALQQHYQIRTFQQLEDLWLPVAERSARAGKP